MTDPEDPTSPGEERPPASTSSTPDPADGTAEDHDSRPASEAGTTAEETASPSTAGPGEVEPPSPPAPPEPPSPPAPPEPPASVAPQEPPSPAMAASPAPAEPAPAPVPPPPATPAAAVSAVAPPPPPPAPPLRPPVDYEEAPATPPTAAATSADAKAEADGDAEANELEPIPRWVSLVNTLGVGLIAVITAQLVTAIAQGFSYSSEEPQGVASDLLHRLGYPFAGNTWILALVALILAMTLISLPVLFDEDTTFGQERAASVALALALVVAVIVCLGSILAVRANLHLVTAGGRAVPDYYRIDLATFLLGTIGTGVLTIYGALVARGMRYNREE